MQKVGCSGRRQQEVEWEELEGWHLDGCKTSLEPSLEGELGLQKTATPSTREEGCA